MELKERFKHLLIPVEDDKPLEKLLYDEGYYWVAIDSLYALPTMIFRTAQEAVEHTIGSDRYTLKPVKLYKGDKKNEQ